LDEVDFLTPRLKTVRWYSNIKLRDVAAAVKLQQGACFYYLFSYSHFTVAMKKQTEFN
jgi:hypothetical protein